MTTPSPEHVEHVARAIYLAQAGQRPHGWPYISDASRAAYMREATSAILASQEWLEKNGADKEG